MKVFPPSEEKRLKRWDLQGKRMSRNFVEKTLNKLDSALQAEAGEMVGAGRPRGGSSLGGCSDMWGNGLVYSPAVFGGAYLGGARTAEERRALRQQKTLERMQRWELMPPGTRRELDNALRVHRLQRKAAFAALPEAKRKDIVNRLQSPEAKEKAAATRLAKRMANRGCKKVCSEKYYPASFGNPWIAFLQDLTEGENFTIADVLTTMRMSKEVEKPRGATTELIQQLYEVFKYGDENYTIPAGLRSILEQVAERREEKKAEKTLAARSGRVSRI